MSVRVDIISDDRIDSNGNVCDIYKNKCVFCDQRLKKLKGVACELHKCKSQNLRDHISALLRSFGDQKYRKIDTVDIDSSYFSYHKQCYNKVSYSACKELKRSASPNLNQAADTNKSILASAYQIAQDFVKKNIVKKQQIYPLSDVYAIFVEAFTELTAHTENDNREKAECYKRDYLLGKLKKDLPNLGSCVHNRKTYLHTQLTDVKHVMASIKEFPQDNDSIKSMAYYLRNKILQMQEKYNCSDTLTDDEMCAEKQNIPEELLLFVRHLINGPRMAKESKSVKVVSISSSIINCVSHASIKTTTSVSLALALKTMTGSRKILDLMNRLGHSVSYSMAQEIETEIAYKVSSKNSILPAGLITGDPEYFVGAAFDNFDRNTETSTGRNGMHNTVGIVYQIIPTNEEDEKNSNMNKENLQIAMSTANDPNRRRRYVSLFDGSIEPYSRGDGKIPQLVKTHQNIPSTLKSANMLDHIWMMNFALKVPANLRWTDWNEKYHKDLVSRHRIEYLPQISMPPTNDSVVFKTLNMCLELADECNQQYIVVTYDLGIANRAYRIQAEHSPIFDRIFINLGPFHIELAFFKALGKLLDGCGIPKLFTSAGLIAEGSLNAVMKGKHFNRCKRLHSVGALALKMLHFEQFLQSYQTDDGKSLDIAEVSDILNSCTDADYMMNILTDVVEKYDEYFRDTFNGKSGKTPQFACIYIHYMEIYYLLERALRTSDLELYKYALHQLLPLFFQFNHSNYARWLTLNYNKLMNMDVSHPGLSCQFNNGILSIRRSKKNFSRTPVDLTLEQTINANCASKLTGITAFRNNESAIQKWAVTHSTRMSIVHRFLEFVGLMKLDDLALDGYQNKVFNKNLCEMAKTIKSTIDPFDHNLDASHLFNLTTGKAASEETADFLLNIVANGRHQMNKFIQMCQENENSFNSPIQRNTIKNFASEIIKNSSALPQSSRITAIKEERNIVSRLLSIALNRKLDLTEVFANPLSTVPYSLSHCDGTMHVISENKSVLSLIQGSSKCAVVPTETFDVEIIDAYYFLNNIQESPMKYGDLAIYILKLLCDTKAKEIHWLFGTNSREYNLQNHRIDKMMIYNDNSAFKINGPQQERIAALSKYLSNMNYRKELVDFILKYWQENERALEILKDKRIFVSYENECFLYCSEYERKKNVPKFANNHIEVETLIILHLAQVPTENTILVKTGSLDDVLIYILYHMQFALKGNYICIEMANVKKNAVERVNIRTLHDSLNKNVLNALPGWFVFTGCKYEPAFYNKGRATTFKKMIKFSNHQTAFSKLGMSTFKIDETTAELERFVCELYQSKEIDVNRARAKIFENVIKQNIDGTKLKGIIYLCTILYNNIISIK